MDFYSKYEKLRNFLIVPKSYNNLKPWNLFSYGTPSIKWSPKVPVGRERVSGTYYYEWRRLTFSEFIIWYNADRKYLDSKDND